MNQTLSKTDFVPKSCESIILCKKSNRRFFLYAKLVNVLPLFLTRTSKNDKNLLVSFSIVNVILGVHRV